jgi:hypothetical protein
MVSWVLIPCRTLCFFRSFVHHEDEVNTFPRNVGENLLCYMMWNPRMPLHEWNAFFGFGIVAVQLCLNQNTRRKIECVKNFHPAPFPVIYKLTNSVPTPQLTHCLCYKNQSVNFVSWNDRFVPRSIKKHTKYTVWVQCRVTACVTCSKDKDMNSYKTTVKTGCEPSAAKQRNIIYIKFPGRFLFS